MRLIFDVVAGCVAAVFVGAVCYGLAPRSRQDMAAIVGSSLAFAVAFLLVDFVIGRQEKAEQELRRRARGSAAPKVFRRQIVGAKCGICGETLLLITDGVRCEGCDGVYHKTCLEAKHGCPRCVPLMAEVLDDS